MATMISTRVISFFAFQAGTYVSAATPLSAVAAVFSDDAPLVAGDVDGVFELDDKLLGSDEDDWLSEL